MSSSKEAIAIVLDIGPSMCKLGGAATHLQQACQLVSLILKRKLFSESKDEVSLVLFGTEKSKNDLSMEVGGYTHVSLDTPVSPVTFESIEQFNKFTKPEVTHSADFIDALIVAMDELKQKTEGVKAFAGKRIILLSSLAEPFSSQQVDDVIASLQEHQFGFTYLGPDDVPTEGDKGMKVVRKIIDAVEGDQFTFQEVYPCLSTIQSRCIRPTAWKATLTIATSLQVPVCMYIKVKGFKPRSFSKVWAKDPSLPLQQSTTYQLADSTPVNKADVIDCYRFGPKLVPFPAEEKKKTALETEKCFKLLGFTKMENVKRRRFFGDSVWMCMAEKDNKAAQLLFSSLTQALHDSGMVAIVRRVYSDNGLVHVGCLMPHIRADSEFMYYIQLPFSEDIHHSYFKLLPLEPNSTNQHAFNDEQLKAMNGLIDSMNLTKKNKENGDGDGGEEYDDEGELFSPHEVCSPYLQRLYQCLEHRALHPEDPSLPPIPSAIQSLMQLPEHKVLASKPALDKVKELFKVVYQEKIFPKKVENDKLKESNATQDVAPTTRAVEEFKAVLAQSVLSEQEALDSMLTIATSLSQPPSLHLFIDSLTALRKHHLQGGKYNYNDFLRLLKKALTDKGNMAAWNELSTNNLGLVTKEERRESEVSEEEARCFMAVEAK